MRSEADTDWQGSFMGGISACPVLSASKDGEDIRVQVGSQAPGLMAGQGEVGLSSRRHETILYCCAFHVELSQPSHLNVEKPTP